LKLSPKFLRRCHICLINLACLAMSIYTRGGGFAWASGATPCHVKLGFGKGETLGHGHGGDLDAVSSAASWTQTSVVTW